MMTLKTFWTDEAGQSMSEYGLIIAVVVVGLITALVTLRGKMSNLINGISFSTS